MARSDSRPVVVLTLDRDPAMQRYYARLFARQEVTALGGGSGDDLLALLDRYGPTVDALIVADDLGCPRLGAILTRCHALAPQAVVVRARPPVRGDALVRAVLAAIGRARQQRQDRRRARRAERAAGRETERGADGSGKRAPGRPPAAPSPASVDAPPPATVQASTNGSSVSELVRAARATA